METMVRNLTEKRNNSFVICLEPARRRTAEIGAFGYSPHVAPLRRRFLPSLFSCWKYMGIAIRKAAPTDAPAACALLRRSIEEGCAADHRHHPEILANWTGNKTPTNVATWFASPSNHAVVAERDGELLGLALLTQAGKLALCYVLPEGMRSGVGRAMLAGIEEQARAWNIGKLYLHSPASSSAFFERNGYTNAGKEKSCFGLECDFLWKRLDAGPAQPNGNPRKRFCNCSGE
jgi:GNAT superfamily N-acetyltransferase